MRERHRNKEPCSEFPLLLEENKTTSAQIVEEYLAQIDRYEPALNALISPAPREKVLKIAKARDEERQKGQIRGPFHGIPIILKNSFVTASELGMSTTAGSYSFLGAKVSKNGGITQWLIDAGLIILGKANMTVILEERDDKKEKVATGVEVVGGEKYFASREVIVSAGAYRTPQVLMLSGIGPAELVNHNITQLVDAPEFGRNLHDHFSFVRWWKLRHPEQGFLSVLVEALKADGESESALGAHPYLAPDSCHAEIVIVYAPAGAAIAGADIPMDGTHIASAILGMVPTSRGCVTIASADARTPPLIDPNYYSTEVDRAILRAAIRQTTHVLSETPEGKEMIECEAPHPGFFPLRPDSTDEEIDAQVKQGGNTFYHPAGSASMGSVVDTELRVKGVGNLRIVDASIIPLPITAHYEAVVYAIAEKAADSISKYVRYVGGGKSLRNAAI
ncbi:unnamed protein product [Aspergillus oryzae]|nr:unnamed protein product [Aspergillus oryzae]GMF84984.1 unnamed protein product [Aspergillus oryzae]